MIEDKVAIQQKEQFLLKNFLELFKILFKSFISKEGTGNWIVDMNTMKKHQMNTKHSPTSLAPIKAYLKENL